MILQFVNTQFIKKDGEYIKFLEEQIHLFDNATLGYICDIGKFYNYIKLHKVKSHHYHNHVS